MDIVAVSSGLLTPKKGDHPFARKHRYLNYGLLSLATVLDKRGHRVRVYHGGFESPSIVAEAIAREHFAGHHGILLLSLPSCFSIPWAREFLASFRDSHRGVKVIVGGRWVVQDDGQWIRSVLSPVDLVVYGTAESRIERLIDPSNWPVTPGTDLTVGVSSEPDEIPVGLNFRLDNDFPNFQPSIEVSRGCGMRCAFCEERAAPLSALRSPSSLIGGIRHAIDLYGREDLNFYFEASMFLPTRAWAGEFSTAYRDASLSVSWRCETRVDSIGVDVLERLARAGLRVIDLGLESASPTQLLAMGKTRVPSLYLERASRLLHACHDYGVWPKVNVMLYAGETNETANQTIDWLAEHCKYIKGLSVGPVVVYGHNNAAREYLGELARLGALPVDNVTLEKYGYTRLNLSSELNYEASEALSLEIARRFMTQQDYFDLKSFSYFPRTYTYENFVQDLRSANIERLPFRLSDDAEPARKS